ncbi:OsmC family protein [Zavarzinia compransoris]|uniref:OsmC family protein n=1 Tax=Zavarzinia marina TaxID=2911065 RepID=UPI001F23FBDB|nr:OsmC family protein [Zavarzinia marina]MCF4166505.1 OsmC family protein [Zavarzinia marina]
MSEMHHQPVQVGESGNGKYGQFVTVGRHVMGADEPPAMGGADTGPTPFELVMAGLGACTTMTLRMYAERKGWPLEHVSVVVSLRRVASADGKSLSDRYDRAITLKGPLDAEQRAALIAVADRCPVSRQLSAGVAITAAEAG